MVNLLSYIKIGMVEKWDSARDPRIPGTLGTPKTPSNLRDASRPSKLLWTPRTSLEPPVFFGMWCVKRISRE